MAIGLSVSNGVKWGGGLSLVLFAVYMDGLLNEKREGGCYMGITFMGGVSLASDKKLLAPIHKGLTKFTYICEQYAA